ncbi:unnamed protein product [Dibothriocephalus latus]|uniref:Uncharacterized protein n=1 Tax=Dibothriocephalus latus TaxID=60516 RepID=A0A3P6PA51_DIBLA|nr:unnamed protein product [Dibothriocephalus latus]
MVRKEDANSRDAPYSTGTDHTFKFDDAEIFACGGNHVSYELLEACFSGPHSINERNGLTCPYGVLRSFLSKGISHMGRAGSNNNSDDNGHNCHGIITPASDAEKAIVAINESNAKCQDSHLRPKRWLQK